MSAEQRSGNTGAGGRDAIVLGGAGMLAGCVRALLAEGWRVALPSRHRHVITAGHRPGGTPERGAAARAMLPPPGHRPVSGRGRRPGVSPARDGARDNHGFGGSAAGGPDEPATATWVRADWAEPDRLAAATADVLWAPAALLVAWVHTPYRAAVLRAVRPLLAADAPIVEVHGVAGAKPGEPPPRPVIDGHPTRRVLLGMVAGPGPARFLTHGEIVDGVLAAVRHALAGAPPGPEWVGDPPATEGQCH